MMNSRPAMMTLADLQREVAALPTLQAPADAADQSTVEPLQVIARQGRLILKLAAAADATEARLRALGEETGAHLQILDARTEAVRRTLAERERVREELTERLRGAEQRLRQTAQTALHLLDALTWAQEAAGARGDESLAQDLESALRDCRRRLAALGITEIPADGPLDGRLHEGVDAVPDEQVPQYHILRLIRPGYQMGADILRRAQVVTAA